MLSDATKDPDNWISLMEGTVTKIESIDTKMAISDQDFLLHTLNNLPKEYDVQDNVVLDRLESQLDETGDKALTLEMVCEKLSE